MHRVISSAMFNECTRIAGSRTKKYVLAGYGCKFGDKVKDEKQEIPEFFERVGRTFQYLGLVHRASDAVEINDHVYSINDYQLPPNIWQLLKCRKVYVHRAIVGRGSAYYEIAPLEDETNLVTPDEWNNFVNEFNEYQKSLPNIPVSKMPADFDNYMLITELRYLWDDEAEQLVGNNDAAVGEGYEAQILGITSKWPKECLKYMPGYDGLEVQKWLFSASQNGSPAMNS